MGKVKYSCIFGGGGVRGLCYVGAIKALKELNVEIESVAGSSVGAVFAALFAAGYNADEIKELFMEFNLNMFRDINISMFMGDISFSKGEIFLNWLKEKIEKKFYGPDYKENENKPVRFKDLKTDLHILTIDLNTNTPFIFSKKNTPEEEVAFAVRASASLPGLMKPVNMGDSILVDGDLIKSWPAWKIYSEINESNTRILEFRLEGSRKSLELKNPMDYVNSVISTIWYLSTENVFNEYHKNDKYDYIVFDTKEIILFDFNIENEIKNEMIEKGYNDTKKYLLSTLPEKKKEIIEYYRIIIEKLNNFRQEIKSYNPEKAMNIINELLAEMNEYIMFIDKYYYRQIKDLKDNLKINTKKLFLFSSKIDNEKQLITRTEFLITLVQERITELQTYISENYNKC